MKFTQWRNVYLVAAFDHNGDLYEEYWVDSAECQREQLYLLDVPAEDNDRLGVGSHTFSNGMSVEWGFYPNGVETNYDVYCDICGMFMWNGQEGRQNDE